MSFSFLEDTTGLEQVLLFVPEDTRRKGLELFEQGLAAVELLSEKSASVRVFDNKKTSYRVRISYNQAHQFILECPCPRKDKSTFCPHHVAATLQLLAAKKRSDTKWKEVFQKAFSKPTSYASVSQGQIVFSLRHNTQNRTAEWQVLAYAVSEKYIAGISPDDKEAVAMALQEMGEHARIIRNHVTAHQYPAVPEEAIVATNLLASAGINPYSYGYSYAHSYSYGMTYATSSVLGTVFSLLSRCVVFRGDQKNPFREPVKVLPETGTLEVEISQVKDQLHLVSSVLIGDERIPINSKSMTIVLDNPLWVLQENRLFEVKKSFAGITELLNSPHLVISSDEQEEFLNTYLPPLAQDVSLRGEMLNWEEVHEPPVPRLYLSETEGEFSASLRFGYGNYEVFYEQDPPEQDTAHQPGTMDLARIHRQAEAEADLWKSLSSSLYGLKRGRGPGHFVLRKNTDVLEFLLRKVPNLTEAGYEIYGEQNLKAAKVNRHRPTISFSVSSEIDWFDIQAVVNFGELEVSLKDIRRAVRRKDGYVKLSDGSIGELPSEWVDRYRHLFALGEETEDGVRLSQTHLTLIDQLLAEADRAQTDKMFEQRIKQLRSFSSIEPQEKPQRFEGTLRSYQKTGYDWLHFLHSYNFGGCLADDMGTGKTIQTLALLQSLRESGHADRANLIVMPRSLIFNWQREAARFTPDLRLHIHADQNRIQDASEFDSYDLILTTYGVMLRDMELLRQYRFHYIILDESQAIKNPLAETSKAARLLQADHRLALTGTPVENSTMELWSQFAFLNPGLLGNLDYFRREFSTPIERGQDADASQFLRKMVYPFILRRTKDQVQLDLPPRTERILETEMDDEQRTFYNKQRDYYRGLLLGMIEEEGIGQVRFKILEGLLRLRQICNHPRLADPAYPGSSAKFDLLLETLETLQSEGHKALIFSQFVQMLSLLREELDRRNIAYTYLDGQTRNREAVVNRFQEDETVPFFLISLKAGGVGLNLTAASYVIHIDPWWNPAVEMQATDRTHRIGQEKPVFVYKLVTVESVEEKILQLQERKRELVDQIIATESSSGGLKSLTQEDVEVLFT
jgi:non-specific serine/threonine protein kinase